MTLRSASIWTPPDRPDWVAAINRGEILPIAEEAQLPLSRDLLAGEAAARQGLRVRFTTAASLVTELVEAQDAQELGRVVRRYGKVSLLIVDELAYLPLGRSDAELLFRVLGERTERLPVVITTNLPFGEWTTMFPDPRLPEIGGSSPWWTERAATRGSSRAPQNPASPAVLSAPHSRGQRAHRRR